MRIADEKPENFLNWVALICRSVQMIMKKYGECIRHIKASHNTNIQLDARHQKLIFI